MDLSKRKRLRIILLFALGVVLPSLLLGILAFRGIQNDQTLVEKNRLEEHQRAVDLFVEIKLRQILEYTLYPASAIK